MVRTRTHIDIEIDTRAGAAPETKSFRNVQGHPLQNVAVTDAELAAERHGSVADTIRPTAERAAAKPALMQNDDAPAQAPLDQPGPITDLIATGDVHMTKLTRDRSQNVDPDLQELKRSIREVGLSNPIRVEQTDAGYELIQGYRRLSAFRALEQDTGDPRYSCIPATQVPRGEPLEALYRKMVDENLVRKDLSFAEMAQLALSYAEAEGVSPRDAVRTLYASAQKQKRAYIQSFAAMLSRLPGVLHHPEAIPRALGLDLNKALERAPELATQIRDRLTHCDPRNAAAEVQMLRDVLTGWTVRKDKKAGARTSLGFVRPEGAARVIASHGKIELQLDRDFAAVPKADLQRAIDAFLGSLDAA
ncbi:MAG: ParB/RepB/Spo0J family partition protein [Pseudomonadota bacterium]